MIIIGILLFIVAIFLILNRLRYLFFGKSAKGVIVGYDDKTVSVKITKAYRYKVKYKYNNQEYIAYSFESATTFSWKKPTKNFEKEVTVYFFENNPELVTIKEIKQTEICCIITIIASIMCIQAGFMVV